MTLAPVTLAPTTLAPTTLAPTTLAPTALDDAVLASNSVRELRPVSNLAVEPEGEAGKRARTPLAAKAAVTVVMPVLNAASTLRAALQSLGGQSIAYEVIVVDGGSTDDTVAIASSVPGVRLIAAPGTSIYQAINRGIQEARADAICLLNADDALLPGALEALTAALARNPRAGIARGWPRFVEMNASGSSLPLAAADRLTSRPLSLRLLLRGPCAINSLCIRRDVFTRIGPFDPAFRLASDREWMLRAHLADIGMVEVEQPVYRYLIHSASSTLDPERRNYALIRREHLAIVARFLGETRAASLREPILVAALRRWHAAETAMLCNYLLRRRAWREAGLTFGRAFGVNPYWPAAVITDTLSRLR